MRRCAPVPSKVALFAAFALSVAFAAALTQPAAAQFARKVDRTVTGPAEMVDADTFKVQGEIIHLSGLDAPESRQRCEKNDRRFPCGQNAEKLVTRFIGRGDMTCRIVGETVLKKKIGFCSVNDEDIGEYLIRRGYAIPYGRAGARYLELAQKARQNKIGMWGGQFAVPANWRRGLPLQRQTFDGGGRCWIKGYEDQRGRKRYVIPRHRWYAGTKVDPERGGRWFCSEREALAAGFKRLPVFEEGNRWRNPNTPGPGE